MRIKKTSQYIEGGASLSNEYGTSNSDGYTQSYINELQTYSTDEVRVGTWVDGKPLYRRAFTGTTSTTSHNYILTNTNDIAKLIGYKGYIEQSNTVQLEIGSSVYHSDGNINTSTRVINVNNNLRLDENYNVFGGKYFEVAVEYTKTTD